MKVLIQDRQSKKFFAAVGGWVQDAREASDFESYRHAYDAAREAAVTEFNIMLFSSVGGYLFGVDQGKN
jgi:hypothetical protein